MTQQMRNEIDMLQGNINRMCVTDDEIELARMRDFAKIRIDRLFSMKQSQLRKKRAHPCANRDELKRNISIPIITMGERIVKCLFATTAPQASTHPAAIRSVSGNVGANPHTKHFMSARVAVLMITKKARKYATI